MATMAAEPVFVDTNVLVYAGVLVIYVQKVTLSKCLIS
jgi:hypothetical protein